MDATTAPIVELAYRSFGSGPPVVFLHGGGPGCSSWSDFRDCADHAASDHQRLFVDLAQYGDSAADRFHGPALDYHAACLLALLDTLGHDRVDVIAQSLGGSVALNLAATHPDRIRRMVVTGSQPTPSERPGSAGPDVVRRIRSTYYGGEGPSPTKMRALLAELEWWDAAAIPARTVAARYEHSLTPWALAVADGTGRGEPQDLSGRLRDVPHPTLWVWGTHDPFAAPDYACSVAAQMPRGDVAVLGRTSHHPQEERPVAYGRIVQEFLMRKDHR